MDDKQEYDVILTCGADTASWSGMLAKRLAGENLRVRRITPRSSQSMSMRYARASRALVHVCSPKSWADAHNQRVVNAFRKARAKLAALSRPIIRLSRISRAAIKPRFNTYEIDFANDDDFELSFFFLLTALRNTRPPSYESETERDLVSSSPTERGRLANERGQEFEQRVAALYETLGFDVEHDRVIDGTQFDLIVHYSHGGLSMDAVVECKDTPVTSRERDQVMTRWQLAKEAKYGCAVVSSQGFAARARKSLESVGVKCLTYQDLLNECVPLERYTEQVVLREQPPTNEDWQFFVRPDLYLDGSFERQPAVSYIGRWLRSPSNSLLLLLGDLGTGKTTIGSFLANRLALAFRQDPTVFPAPVFIPLRDARDDDTLERVVVRHFEQKLGLDRPVNFRRFQQLCSEGKIVVVFDAFDEMCELTRWEVTKRRFSELCRAAFDSGKVLVTCRTHYFRDDAQQTSLMGNVLPFGGQEETSLYRELSKFPGANLAYLQGFDERQVKAYLQLLRPSSWENDWNTIIGIYNLKDLSQRPLMLDMIVRSLRQIQSGGSFSASQLYKVYTEIWINREEVEKGRILLDRKTKLELMFLLARNMWEHGTATVDDGKLASFVESVAKEKRLEIGENAVALTVQAIRTASFLRRDDSEGNCSFAHRSFMEYFLAREIQHRLRNFAGVASVRAALRRRLFDQKVAYFLAQLDAEPQVTTEMRSAPKDEEEGEKREEDLQLADERSMEDVLRDILLAGYEPRVSENALQLVYWFARIQSGREQNVGDVSTLRQELLGCIPNGLRLRRAKLDGIDLRGATLVEADLRNADLTNARLDYARLENVRLDGARLIGVSHEGIDEQALETCILNDAEVDHGSAFSRVRREIADRSAESRASPVLRDRLRGDRFLHDRLPNSQRPTKAYRKSRSVILGKTPDDKELEWWRDVEESLVDNLPRLRKIASELVDLGARISDCVLVSDDTEVIDIDEIVELMRHKEDCDRCGSRLPYKSARCISCSFHPDDYIPETEYDIGGQG